MAIELFTFWRRPLFAIDGTTFQAIDVALAAMVRGEWSQFERRVAEGLACQASAVDRGGFPGSTELDAAAEAFRYDRDLISADEMNAWLERTGVSANEWQAYLARDLLRQGQGHQVDDLLDRYPPSSRALAEVAFVEGVCSGLFDQFERTFSERAVLVADIDASQSVANDRSVAELVAHTHAHWLSAWPTGDVRARLDRLVSLDAAFEDAAAALTSSERMADQVELHKLDWRLIVTDTLRFGAEHAAREALLCVSADRLSLHEVAALCRRAATREVRFHDEIAEDLRDQLLVLDVGAVVGPFAVNGSFDVTVVLGHHLPSLADPRVVARAKAAVVDPVTRRAAHDRVRRVGPP